MSLFCNKEIEVIENLTKIIDNLLAQRHSGCRRKPHKRRPTLVLSNQNNIIMKTTLTLGSNATASLILVDNVTLQPVQAPVAVGAGNILLSTIATYVDSNTGQTVTATFTASYPFIVIVTPEGLTLSLTDFVNVGSTTTTSSTTV